jgi:hypothetical protein
MQTILERYEMSAELFKSLAAAQAKFPEIIKDKVNPHFKSKYVSLDAILSATRPALTENGLAVSSRFGEHSIEAVLLHSSGEQITSGPVPLLLGKNDMQGLGSAITYARRYAIGALLGISPDEDDDGNAAAASAKENPYRKEAEQRKPPSPPPTTSTNGKAKPAKPTPKDIKACKTADQLSGQLVIWRGAYPISTDPKMWRNIEKTVLAYAAERTAAGAWNDDNCASLNDTLDSIKGAIALVEQGAELLPMTKG